MHSKKSRKKVLTCPDCGSYDLYYETGLITGYKYHCKKCQYVGAFVIEKYIDLDAEPDQNLNNSSEKQ